MTFSVALCTYNGAAYLGAQLDSITRQTRPPDEVVICDDGSQDATVSLARAFAQSAPFPVQVIVNPHNLGVVPNFENAIRRCSGAFIALCDQDDVWQPHKLERLENALTDDVGAAFSNARVVDQHLQPLGYTLWESVRFSRRDQARVRGGQAFGVLLRRNVVTGATLAFRRDMVDRLLPIPPGWMHDAWIALMIAAAAGVALVDEPLIDYRQHAHNQIGTRIKPLLARQGSADPAPFLAARDRLQTFAAPGVLAQIDAKVRHLEARSSLPRARWRRVPPLLRELTAGRYHRCSGGWWSFAKDLTRA